MSKYIASNFTEFSNLSIRHSDAKVVRNGNQIVFLTGIHKAGAHVGFNVKDTDTKEVTDLLRQWTGSDAVWGNFGKGGVNITTLNGSQLPTSLKATITEVHGAGVLQNADALKEVLAKLRRYEERTWSNDGSRLANYDAAGDFVEVDTPLFGLLPLSAIKLRTDQTRADYASLLELNADFVRYGTVDRNNQEGGRNVNWQRFNRTAAALSFRVDELKEQKAVITDALSKPGKEQKEELRASLGQINAALTAVRFGENIFKAMRAHYFHPNDGHAGRRFADFQYVVDPERPPQDDDTFALTGNTAPVAQPKVVTTAHSSRATALEQSESSDVEDFEEVSIDTEPTEVFEEVLSRKALNTAVVTTEAQGYLDDHKKLPTFARNVQVAMDHVARAESQLQYKELRQSLATRFEKIVSLVEPSDVKGLNALDVAKLHEVVQLAATESFSDGKRLDSKAASFVEAVKINHIANLDRVRAARRAVAESAESRDDSVGREAVEEPAEATPVVEDPKVTTFVEGLVKLLAPQNISELDNGALHMYKGIIEKNKFGTLVDHPRLKGFHDQMVQAVKAREDHAQFLQRVKDASPKTVPVAKSPEPVEVRQTVVEIVEGPKKTVVEEIVDVLKLRPIANLSRPALETWKAQIEGRNLTQHPDLKGYYAQLTVALNPEMAEALANESIEVVVTEKPQGATASGFTPLATIEDKQGEEISLERIQALRTGLAQVQKNVQSDFKRAAYGLSVSRDRGDRSRVEELNFALTTLHTKMSNTHACSLALTIHEHALTNGISTERLAQESKDLAKLVKDDPKPKAPVRTNESVYDFANIQADYLIESALYNRKTAVFTAFGDVFSSSDPLANQYTAYGSLIRTAVKQAEEFVQAGKPELSRPE